MCDRKVVRPAWNNSSRVNHKNFSNKTSHPHPKRSFVPQAVLTRSGKLSTASATVNTVRSVNTANTKAVKTARPVNTAASKQTVNHPRSITNSFKRGYSQSSRPFNRHFVNKNSIIKTNVNTVSVKHTTARDRAVKEYKEKGVIDSGCSRHMTGNKCYLDEYEDYDGGFVSFGDGKGRISGKGKIKTGKLDFDDVYFCKELKYNMFSVSQMCDKKNNALFTDIEFIAGKKTNGIAGTKDNTVASQAQKEKEPEQEYILIPICTTDPSISQVPKDRERDNGMKPTEVDENEALDTSGKDDEATRSESERLNQREMQTKNTNITNGINTVSTPVSTAGPTVDTAVPSPPINTAEPFGSTANAFEEHLFEKFSPLKNAFSLSLVPNISSMDNTSIFRNAYDDEVVEKIDMNNVNSSYTVPDTSFTKFHKDHPEDQEPKKVLQALEDPSWVEAMQNELLQFKLLNVWTLVDLPRDKWAIGTKWVFRNKKDERGIVVKNKARLVAQGHTQEEGIDYDEVFAPVARIEAIRLFLAYASFKDFVVYQMDVKSAFLYGKIEEEVYVCQPPRFEDPHFPNKVYKVEKALYGLHQAPRAWYETLSTYLLDNGFHRGQIDKTLFIRRHKDDILLVQVYVDDIIFGSTKKEMSTEFEKLMHDKFQMSSMGELSFFLGLQVKQKSDGIFISQDKYVAEILKKFDLASIKTASTPMETNKPLTKDEEAENVDVHLYRSMIGSLMYLTASRPDIMFAVCACARFQVTPKTSHLHAVKRIFRYLKGQPKLGLWYPRDSPFDLEAFSDSDFAGASLDRKSTTGELKLLGKTGRDTKIPQSGGSPTKVGDEAVHKELGDRMERASTTAFSLETEQDSVNTLGSGEDSMKLMELMTHCTKLSDMFWEAAAASTSENGEIEITATIDGRVKTVNEASIRRHLNLEDSDGIPTLPNTKIFEQLALMGVQSLGSDEGSLTLNELTVLYTTLSNKAESLESDLKQTKLTYSSAYTKLIRRVKKLEHKLKSSKARRRVRLVVSEDESDLEDPSKQGRKIGQIDKDDDITLVQMGAQTQVRINEDLMYETGVYDYPKGFTGPSVSITTKPVTTAGEEVSTAGAILEGVSTARAIPKVVTTAEPDIDVTLAESLVDLLKSGKKESPKPKAREQAEFERLQKERVAQEEASKAAIDKELDDIQAMIKSDEQMAARLQSEEQEKYTIKEKARMLVEMIAERKKFFDAQRAVGIRSRPPKKAQVSSFVPMDTEVIKDSGKKDDSSSKPAGGSRKKTLARKRAGEKQSEESTKRQKMEDDAKKEELKAYLDIVPGDEFGIKVESLATKYTIVDWKTHILTENFMYYQIIRAYRSSKNYKIFSEMLDDFDRQDVMDLHRLVEERMLSRRLEVDHESEMAFELLRFIRSQL
ncbi:putative ribonuclease H-like domain-containing protein [Tanacetum coccineum]